MARRTTLTSWRQEFRAGIEDILDTALFDVLPNLENAAECASFAPERLEALLDVDAQVTSAACTWLDLADDTRSESMTTLVRRAVDSAAFACADPIVVRIKDEATSGGGSDREVLVPHVLGLGLCRCFEVAFGALPENSEVTVTLEDGGLVAVDAAAPVADPLAAMFLQLFGDADVERGFRIDLGGLGLE